MTSTKMALIISMALNLVLVGIFAGTLMKRKPDARPHTPPGIERLSKDQRLQARNVLREAFSSASVEREAHIASREALVEIFSHDPLPQAEAEAALETLRQTEVKMRARMQKMLLEDLSTHPPEVRAYIIQRMLGRSKRSHSNRPDHGPERPQ